MTGSLRQRGENSWELRVYDGVHPDTGRKRFATGRFVARVERRPSNSRCLPRR